MPRTATLSAVATNQLIRSYQGVPDAIGSRKRFSCRTRLIGEMDAVQKHVTACGCCSLQNKRALMSSMCIVSLTLCKRSPRMRLSSSIAACSMSISCSLFRSSGCLPVMVWFNTIQHTHVMKHLQSIFTQHPHGEAFKVSNPRSTVVYCDREGATQHQVSFKEKCLRADITSSINSDRRFNWPRIARLSLTASNVMRGSSSCWMYSNCCSINKDRAW